MVVKYTEIDHAAHREAVKMLNRKGEYAEKDMNVMAEYIFKNYNPDIAFGTRKEADQAYYTPYELALQMAQEFNNHETYVDLGAGIGVLAFGIYERFKYERPNGKLHVICVENNPQAIEVGKILVPQATWIEADVLELDPVALTQVMDAQWFITNPPFNAKRVKSLTAPEAITQFIEVGLRYTRAHAGFAIMPVKYSPRVSTPPKWCSAGYKIKWPKEYYRYKMLIGNRERDIAQLGKALSFLSSPEGRDELVSVIHEKQDELRRYRMEFEAIEPDKTWHIVPHDQAYVLDEETHHDYWIPAGSEANDKVDARTLDWMERNHINHSYATFTNPLEIEIETGASFRNVGIDVEVIHWEREYRFHENGWK